MPSNDDQLKGCVLGARNATRIDALHECVMAIKEDVKLLTNHYSKRLPTWAMALITALTAAVSVLVTLLVSR